VHSSGRQKGRGKTDLQENISFVEFHLIKSRVNVRNRSFYSVSIFAAHLVPPMVSAFSSSSVPIHLASVLFGVAS
jgi:hypothetical protein